MRQHKATSTNFNMTEENKDSFSEKVKRTIKNNANKFKEKFALDGYKLMGYTILLFEHTFIFKTKKEADKAYKEFEKDKKQVFGWWYGRDDFEIAKNHYEEKYWELYTIWLEDK